MARASPLSGARSGWRSGRSADRLQTGAVLAALVVVLSGCAWLVAGLSGVGAAFAMVAALLAVIPTLPSAAVMLLRGAVPLAPARAPELTMIVATLARRAGLREVPRLYWSPEGGINANAAGHDGEAVIALSDGALHELRVDELRAVLAHEIAHLAAGDPFWMRLTESLVAVIRLVAFLGLTACLALLLIGGPPVPLAELALAMGIAPVVGMMLQSAHSRSREFTADRQSVALTGDPAALVSALRRIDGLNRRPLPWPAEPAAGVILPTFLSSHPPIAERIDRLQAGYDCPVSLSPPLWPPSCPPGPWPPLVWRG